MLQFFPVCLCLDFVYGVFLKQNILFFLDGVYILK